MILKTALFAVIGFTAISTSYADSPLTSIDFSAAYSSDPVIIKAENSNGVLTQELFNFLVDDTRAIDLKMAIINKLSWSIDGKDNAGLFLIFGKKTKKWKDYEVFIENASPDDILCYAYLKSLDNYSDVNQALGIAEIALTLKPNSYTFNIIHALIQAQSNFDNIDNWCSIYAEPNDIRLHISLERDMKIEAEDIIFEYLSFYAEFCIEIIIDDYFTDSNHSSQENYDENTSEDEQNLSEDELHIQDSIRSFEKYSGENEQGENDEFSLIMDQLIGSSYLINKTEGLYDRIIANGVDLPSFSGVLVKLLC
jgi:hypothetical protein